MSTAPSTPFLSSGAKHMFAATFFFAIMNVFIKVVSHLPVMEIVFFRCGIAAALCVVSLQRDRVSWKGTNHRLLVLRGIFGTTALALYFYTIAHMRLGTAVTIQYLSPVFTTILALFIHKEPVSPRMWLCFIISFAGVLLMKGYDDQLALGLLGIGLLASIASAFAYNTVRALGDREHPAVVVLHFQLIGTVAGGLWSIGDFQWPAGWDWLYLIIIGVFTQLGQMSMTRALQQENVANVSIINYTGVLYAVLFGIFVFGEHYPATTLMGIALVIGGVGLSLIFRSRVR